MYVDDDDEGYLDYENEGFQSLIMIAPRGGSYAGTRIIPKVPPTFNGQSSWLEYEDQIEDLLGITTLSPESGVLRSKMHWLDQRSSTRTCSTTRSFGTRTMALLT